MNHIDSFLYVRHGQTDWNAQGLMQFHSDIPLNATGRKQAQNAAQRLAKLSGERLFFLYSPYSRAAETADIIANHLQSHTDVTVAGITPHAGLKERFGGTLDGRTPDELKALGQVDSMGFMPCGNYVWDNLKMLCPKAECSLVLVKRMEDAFLNGHKQALAHNAKLVIVGHYGGMNTFSRHKLGRRKEYNIQNATPYWFVNEYDTKGEWLIKEME